MTMMVMVMVMVMAMAMVMVMVMVMVKAPGKEATRGDLDQMQEPRTAKIRVVLLLALASERLQHRRH